MATGGDGGKRSRTLLDFNFVKKKIDQDQDENEQGSNQGKSQLFYVFCLGERRFCTIPRQKFWFTGYLVNILMH